MLRPAFRPARAMLRGRPLLFSSLVLVLPMEALSANVGINAGGCAYATVQDAIDNAATGDTIWIEAGGGAHTESWVVDVDDLHFKAADASCAASAAAGVLAAFVAEPGRNTVHLTSAVTEVKFSAISLGSGSAEVGHSGANITATSLPGGVELTMWDSLVYAGHGAGTGAGGIQLSEGNVFLIETDVLGNDNMWSGAAPSSLGGGAVGISSSGNIQLEGNTLIRNSDTSGIGGAILLEGSGQLRMIDDSRVADANADGEGGCVWATNVDMEGNAMIEGCEADATGAVYVSARLDMLGNATIRDSEALSGRGGLVTIGSERDLGGAAYIRGNASLTNGVTAGRGGLVHLAAGSDLQAWGDAVFEGGYALDGGAISSHEGPNGSNRSEIDLSGSVVVRGNEALGYGGGIYVNDALLSITDNVHIGDVKDPPVYNQAAAGGGIYAEGGSEVTLGIPGFDFFGQSDWRLDQLTGLPDIYYAVHVTRNSAGELGAGIAIDNSTLDVYDAALYDNRAIGSNTGGDGGAVALVNQSIGTFERTHVGLNRARRNGGGIYANYSDVFFGLPVSDSSWCWTWFDTDFNSYCNQIRDNQAARPVQTTVGTGGGVFAENGAVVWIDSTGMVDNSSRLGGVHVWADDAVVDIDTSLLADAGSKWPSTEGVRVTNGASMTARYSTFAGDGTTIQYDSGTSGLFSANIVWPDGGVGAGLVTGGPISGHCNVGLGTPALAGLSNINVDPLLGIALRGPYRLPTGGPAEDHCSFAPPTCHWDLDGVCVLTPSFQDVGAFESP